jgi:hypothetical protein
MRNVVIASLAAAAIIAGTAFDAAARPGGMSRSSGGMGASAARMGPISGRSLATPARPVGNLPRPVGNLPRPAAGPLKPGKVVLHPKLPGKHPIKHVRLHKRFHIYAAAGYPYYDSCYDRIWTKYGWRWTYVCGPYPY